MIVTLAINIVHFRSLFSFSRSHACDKSHQLFKRAPLQVFSWTSQDLLARVVKFITTVALQSVNGPLQRYQIKLARCLYLRSLNRCVCCTRWHLITFRVELEMVNKCFHGLLKKSIKIKADIFYYYFFNKHQFKNFLHILLFLKKKKN